MHWRHVVRSPFDLNHRTALRSCSKKLSIQQNSDNGRCCLTERTNRLPFGAATCCTSGNCPPTKENEMRRAFMSIQKGSSTYLKDLTLDANLELGDFGACRRR